MKTAFNPELTGINKPTNAERLARYHAKRGAMPVPDKTLMASLDRLEAIIDSYNKSAAARWEVPCE